jgi:hypothetical protein
LPTTPTETSPVSSPDTQRKSPPRTEIQDPEFQNKLAALRRASATGMDAAVQSAIFPLRCDASDVSQLVGLAMALELRERDLPAHASVPASVVRNHARALMEKRIEDPSAVPMEVSAAVYSVIQTLHELPVNQ